MEDAEASHTFSSLNQLRLQRLSRRLDNTLTEEISDLIFPQREIMPEVEAVAVEAEVETVVAVVVASEEAEVVVSETVAVEVASVVAVVAALAEIAEVAEVASVAAEVETVVDVEACPSTQQQRDLSKPHREREFSSIEW